ncbi:DUF2577 domain-containing protein [Gorillibacterium sp. sgz500922]|uniref:DUF2577 domain-containing protein n=1 Tax=Gorillibacterium sp. sgz500922 TaxID=3446694 RepID=UPI003F6772E9
MSLLETIKRAGMDAVSAANPVELLFGTVTGTAPLEVALSQRLTLDEDFLVIPESLTPAELTIGGTVYPLRKGLAAGDRVALLQMQGGGKFLLLDKVVSG